MYFYTREIAPEVDILPDMIPFKPHSTVLVSNYLFLNLNF